MSGTKTVGSERDEYGRLLPGNRPPGAGNGITRPPGASNFTAYQLWTRPEPAAAKAVKQACQSECFEILPKLKALVDDPRPTVQILAMEAILRLAYGKPSVARLVKSEVERLTGQRYSFPTISSWPDGKLNDLQSSEPLDPPTLDIDPPDPKQQALDTIATKQSEIAKMERELSAIETELKSRRDTIQTSQRELAILRERFEIMHAVVDTDAE